MWMHMDWCWMCVGEAVQGDKNECVYVEWRGDCVCVCMGEGVQEGEVVSVCVGGEDCGRWVFICMETEDCLGVVEGVCVCMYFVGGCP